MEVFHLLKGCELEGWKAPGAQHELKSSCSSPRAKSTSVDCLVKGRSGGCSLTWRTNETWNTGCENWKVEGWKHQASRKKLRKGRREISGPGKQAGEEERLCQKLFSTWNSREKEEQTILQHRSVSAQSVPYPLCRLCSLLPPARQQFCFHYRGKLEKLHPQSQCLVPPCAVGRGSPGHGAPKEPLQIKSFTICLVAEGYWILKIPPWMT